MEFEEHRAGQEPGGAPEGDHPGGEPAPSPQSPEPAPPPQEPASPPAEWVALPQELSPPEIEMSAAGGPPVGPPAAKRSSGKRIWIGILMLAFLGGLGTGAYYYLEQRAEEIARVRAEEAARREQERLEKARGAARIASEPAGAEILLNGKPVGTTPATVGDLKLGKHQFKLRLNGYEEGTTTAEVREDQVANPGVVRLTRSTGRVQITTVPPGAEFTLEAAGQPAKAPEPPPVAKTGDGNVVVTPSGPVVEFRPGTTAGSQGPQPDGAAMPLAEAAGPPAPGTGTSSAAVAPGQADSKGAFRGVTPANLDRVPTGKYVLRVKLGSWALAQDVEVLRDQTVSVRPEFLFGAVTITSNPPGAWVKRDGIALGQTPLRLAEVKPGPVSFTLEMESHETATVSGTVAAAQETTLNGELLAIGEIVVLTEPAGAAVVVNGNEMGVSPLAIRGTSGSVQVKLVLAGFYEEDLTLEIKGGERLEQKIMLQKPSGHGIGIPVPGKPGYVRSPYSPNSGLVEVRDFATGRPYARGTEVKCPFTGRVFEVP